MDEKELQEMKEYRDPLTEKLGELEQDGYQADFKMEDGKLHVIGGDQAFSADELTITERLSLRGRKQP